MRISVFGMGYVGCVTAACLVKQGHNVIGVDIIKSKIKGLNNDIWPVYEPGLNELNKKQILKEKFFATSDEKKALKETEVGIICVGTPNMQNGNINLNYI
jgi:GDP-mannose 6-dehydrogenase